MLKICRKLSTLDLSSFNTYNVKDTSNMFDGCTRLSTIYSSGLFTTINVEDGSHMFDKCYMLTGGNGTVYDEKYTNKTYARIDTPTNKGYFTKKA